ncbi:hypothetical protein AD953_05100 [Acetobacter malorum]|uniref:Uncharacterized protein n=1 Tax=Acetobacter malorum TaxID=178901 RepID=A0A149V9P8_9PROT|nr:hypothetical protein [Acetobacter malorum]KXV76846.1 hypothetical protein AD953_05100 [Acetobacter malorum]
MTTVTATNSHAISALVAASEDLFATLTGKPLSDNATKISTGVTSLLDGLFPALVQKVSFDLDGVLEGSTEVLTGLNTAITAAKTKQAVEQSAAITGGA